MVRKIKPEKQHCAITISFANYLESDWNYYNSKYSLQKTFLCCQSSDFEVSTNSTASQHFVIKSGDKKLEVHP